MSVSLRWNSAARSPMDTIRLPADFRDFLRLLNLHRVEYLLIGGYAVCFHGYYRNTADIDIWIAVNSENAAKLVRLIREFGFNVPELSDELFLRKGRIIRMGIEPTRIELITEISGCDFAECYPQKVEGILDGIPVNIISLPQLIKNKIKSGRLKDLDDVQKLTR
jgi:predicted nucleotidyltransferase